MRWLCPFPLTDKIRYCFYLIESVYIWYENLMICSREESWKSVMASARRKKIKKNVGENFLLPQSTQLSMCRILWSHVWNPSMASWMNDYVIDEVDFFFPFIFLGFLVHSLFMRSLCHEDFLSPWALYKLGLGPHVCASRQLNLTWKISNLLVGFWSYEYFIFSYTISLSNLGYFCIKSVWTQNSNPPRKTLLANLLSMSIAQYHSINEI